MQDEDGAGDQGDNIVLTDVGGALDRLWIVEIDEADEGSRSAFIRSSSASALQASGASAMAFQKPRTQLRTAPCDGFVVVRP